MTSLHEYIDRAETEEKKQRLKSQYKSFATKGEVLCSCGLLRGLTNSFRCLYCGEWYCVNCAEIHFGQTILEWRKNKTS